MIATGEHIGVVERNSRRVDDVTPKWLLIYALAAFGFEGLLFAALATGLPFGPHIGSLLILLPLFGVAFLVMAGVTSVSRRRKRERGR